jgi:hypothetical protein
MVIIYSILKHGDSRVLSISLPSLYEVICCISVEVMVSLIVAALCGIALFGISRKIMAWRKNYKVAVTSGFPVFYSP